MANKTLVLTGWGWMEYPVAAAAALMGYDYPGNVRELLNLLERASVLGESDFAALVREHRVAIDAQFSACLWYNTRHETDCHRDERLRDPA